MLKTILIVEDDVLNMKLFNDLLQSHGFKTLQSVDGMDTLQMAKEHRPDLIIMDIRLPELSGLEHTKMLKADDDLKRIPVIAVSGFAMVGDKERILEAGCDAYLSKPIPVPHFLDEVKRFLAMGPFRLSASLMTGHAAIDAEHDQLGAHLNQFMDFLAENDDKGCEGKINEITNALKSHFGHEERIMSELGYKGLETHKTEHLEIIKNYDALKKDTERNGYGGSLASELTSILVHDMIRADMDFKEYLQEIDYQESTA